MQEIIKEQNSIPKIYAYADINYPNCLKVGFTTRNNTEERIKEQYIGQPKKTWELKLEEFAIDNNGNYFDDHKIHKILEKYGFKKIKNQQTNIATEWFKCTIDDVRAAIIEARTGESNVKERKIYDFPMRPEQIEAVEKTAAYFLDIKEKAPDKTPHFLWNAKMRFGKTFTAYQLAKKMGWKRILILTFKPAVQNAWQEDLNNHIDFKNWKFIDTLDKDAGELYKSYTENNKNYSIVAFASFQNFLGKDKKSNIKEKNRWAYEINWDCVIFDEYHFGAWRERAKELFADDEEDNFKNFDEDNIPITTNHYLYLSGTPFRAIATGEFVEEQIFNWTYSDEQKAKNNWDNKQGINPYAELPQMLMLTYKIPDYLARKTKLDELDFDLNEFFKVDNNKNKSKAKFLHQDEVQKWLFFLQNNLTEDKFEEELRNLEKELKIQEQVREKYKNVENSKLNSLKLDIEILKNDILKLKQEKPKTPFADVRLLSALNHTLWFLPDVGSCYAMKNLLKLPQNTFFKNYKIIVCAGKEAGIGVDALNLVKQEIDNNPKTITLSCGKLTTGITIKEWGGIFMLRNCSSPETYFQAAFRVQSPHFIPSSNNHKDKIIIKEQCFVFDFAPNRTLRQVSEYASQLDNNSHKKIEQRIEELLKFLPILAYDGASMREIDASGVLDFALSGTTASLLARKWESALLVNVDNLTLQNLMLNPKAMEVLRNIEGFRSLNKDIEKVINLSEKVKKLKKEKEDLEAKEKKELSEAEKEEKKLRNEIQKKLIKFATRIPIFMYLSEYREESLIDVIEQLEPELFYKTTGISQQDFGLLKGLNVFNESLMNEAVFQFKRYEDASLEYTGLNPYEGKKIGGWS